MRLSRRQRNNQNPGDAEATVPDAKEELLDESLITGNTLLAISPLRAPNGTNISVLQIVVHFSE